MPGTSTAEASPGPSPVVPDDHEVSESTCFDAERSADLVKTGDWGCQSPVNQEAVCGDISHFGKERLGIELG